jgi:hypothetical protein
MSIAGGSLKLNDSVAMSGSVDGSVIFAGVTYDVPSVTTTAHVRSAVSPGKTWSTCGVQDTERTERLNFVVSWSRMNPCRSLYAAALALALSMALRTLLHPVARPMAGASTITDRRRAAAKCRINLICFIRFRPGTADRPGHRASPPCCQLSVHALPDRS